MKFTETHEWIELSKEENNVGIVGVTAFAQKELGEIVYVELPQVDKEIKKGEEVAVLESTKAAADIYSPVSGTIIEINKRLTSQPELINHSPENEGWIFKIRLSNPKEWDTLLTGN
jgi:glycine cleavage system H protein